MSKQLWTRIFTTTAALTTLVLGPNFALAAGNGQEKASQTDVRGIRCAENDGAADLVVNSGSDERVSRQEKTEKAL